MTGFEGRVGMGGRAPTKPEEPPPDPNRDRGGGEKNLGRGNMEGKAGKLGWGQLLEAWNLSH